MARQFNSPDIAFSEVTRVLTAIEVDKISKEFKRAVLEGVRIAKEKCPVDEGALRADIDFDIKESNKKIEGKIGNKLKYAPYVHNGTGIFAVNGNGRKSPWKFKVPSGKYTGWHITKGQKPQPYMMQALDELKRTFPERISNCVREGLD